MRVVFIVGVGRSGTSLLQSMFAAHPAIAYMPETGFFRKYVARGALAKLYRSGGQAAVVQRLVEDESFARSELDAAALVACAISLGGQLDKAVYNQMVEAQRAEGIGWVGDKDPRLIEFLPLVAESFPEAVIVNIIRDPRDVLLSKKKAAWSSRGHVWKHIFANRVQLALGRFWGPYLFGANYHEIVYEELIDSPNVVLSKVCDRMGLPFDDGMLSFGGAAKRLVSDSELSWKKETFGPLLTENKEKWKAELPPREAALTELCCKEALEVGGYRLYNRNHQLSLWNKVWLLAGRVVITLADRPYRLYRDLRVKRACKKSK
jgi:hypothetical protein